MASQERTEKATTRRRGQARDKGQFAYSQELTSAIALLACTVTAFYLIGSPEGFRSFFADMLNNAVDGDINQMIRRAGLYFLYLAAPTFATAVVAALVGNFMQGLPVYAKENVGFNFEKLNPMHGLSRLKGQMSWMQWLKLGLVIGIAVLIVWKTLSGSWDQLVTLPAHPLTSSNEILRALLRRIVTYLILVICVMAVADFFMQRYRFEESIKMTKPEVKEDMKSVEGNPMVKGKIKSIQHAAARRRMMARIKNADVIVTNPTHYAVALEYKPGTMGAPRVIAKGRDLIAQRIKELGREHDIPTVENVPLARALYRLVDIDQDIPLELYKAVAEVLAHVYKIRKRLQ